jgi:DNA polymerase-3 subunit alpha
MYRLIESYDQEEIIEVAGRTLPALCLVEDLDGLRLLLVGRSHQAVRGQVWVKAHADGCVAIVCSSGTEWSGILAEDFIEHRIEDRGQGAYRFPPVGWIACAEPPTYRILRAAHTPVEPPVPTTLNPGGFVHLHLHTEYSPLDGLTTVKELVDIALADGEQAVAVTDHAVCAAHPDLAKVATAKGIKPIYGVEANFTDDRFRRGNPEIKDDHRVVRADYRHLIMWAETDEGLRNLWAASTEANLTGFYDRPRLDWDVLERHAEGVMCSTACLRGPLGTAILADDEDLLRQRLGRLQPIFDGRLWIELHTNQVPEQRKVNEVLVAVAEQYSLPTIAVVDSHYPCAADQYTHRVWLASATASSVTDDADLFAGDHEYHMMTQAEVRRNLDYLPASVVDEAIAQTVVVANRCQAQIREGRRMPVFSRKGGVDEDRRRAVDVCMANWERKVTNRGVKLGFGTTEGYIARFEREAKLLTDKGYWGYYLTVWDQTAFAKRNNVLVGPGRGSGSGSLIAYLMDIVEIDAVEAGLMFERFLTEGRDSPPDFDIDYPSSKRDLMQDYCTDRWGADYTMRVGTHLRLKNKGVIKSVAAALKGTIDIHFPDFEAVSKIIDLAEAHSAGQGIPWDELWEQHADIPAPGTEITLEKMRAKYPQVFDLAGKMVGRLKTYGKHAAGMVISTDDPLTGMLPMRSSEKSNQPISEFDMKALELLGLLKFDILTLTNLDTLQMCLDLIQEHYGHSIDFNSWIDEYHDPMVWDEIAAGHTLGMFQIWTPAGTRLTKRIKPRSIRELADVITLVRPGPSNSGLTETYIRRRNGEEPISFLDPRLEEILTPTYGVYAYQEQVLAICQVLAGYSLSEADDIRRLMGKKETEKVQEAGEEFVRRCVELGMDQAAADALWKQLAEFAKYSFNLSHAWAYAMIGYWTAWLKIHYPSMFFTAILSTVEEKRIPEFVVEARRMGFSVLPPDINVSGETFRPVGGITVRYGLKAIKGIGDAAVTKILAAQPYTSFEDFQERSGVDSGVRSTLVAAGALDSVIENRRALEERLAWQKTPEFGRCQNKDDTAVGPNGLPCTFDWANEPVVIGKSGRPMKPKDPPRRCTKACRQYVPRADPDFDSLTPYTAADIRDREKELLGVYLSSSPFDRIPKDILAATIGGAEFEAADLGTYDIAAIVTRISPTRDRHGRNMAFIDLDARTGTVTCVVFNDQWAKYQENIKKDRLCLVVVTKTTRGPRLDAYVGL